MPQSEAKPVRRLAPPQIDLGPLYHGDAEARRVTVAAIRSACLRPGFFSVYNSNVSAALVERVYAQSARFHALPDNAGKRRLHEKHSPYKRGWLPLFEEPAYEPGAMSHCASFNLARELPPQPRSEAYANLGPNVWPALDGFREDVYGYYLACSELGQTLFCVFAEALGLEQDFFTRRSTDRSPSTMRLLHYPANAGAADYARDNSGISAHTDFECFTIMHQSAPGLQLLTAQNEWTEVPVPTRGDQFIIILGDMLERWSNGFFRATRHRVVNTPWERYSLILFCAADQDVVVEPLAPFVSAARPARYPPVTQQQHISRALQTAMHNLELTSKPR